MEEVESIKGAYKVLKCKCTYLKSYLEHAVALSRRSSDLLFRALQIPRDTAWSDAILAHLIEASERQRAVFDETAALYGETLFKELDGLIATIVEDMRVIDEEMKAVAEKPVESLKELREARDKHVDAWIHGRQDPWVTEVELKRAIKKVLVADGKANREMHARMGGFGASLQAAGDKLKEILAGFVRIQRQKYQRLGDSLGGDVEKHDEMDRFFDTVSESPKEAVVDKNSDERMREKIDTSFETLVEGISKELSGRSITVRKNLEPVKSSICRVKKGYTGDWVVAYMVITSTGYAHFLDVSGLVAEGGGLKDAIDRLSGGGKGLISMFETARPSKEGEGDRIVFEVNSIVQEAIEEALSSPIVASVKLGDNVYELDKERRQVSVTSKHQNGLASFFGVSEVKARFFTPSNAVEMFHALKTGSPQEESRDDLLESPEREECAKKELKIFLQEENPWVGG